MHATCNSVLLPCRTLQDCHKEVLQQSDMLPCCQAEVLEQEERLQAVFQPLPMHYIEIAHLLLTHAKDTFSDGENDTLTKVGLASFHALPGIRKGLLPASSLL